MDVILGTIEDNFILKNCDTPPDTNKLKKLGTMHRVTGTEFDICTSYYWDESTNEYYAFETTGYYIKLWYKLIQAKYIITEK